MLPESDRSALFPTPAQAVLFGLAVAAMRGLMTGILATPEGVRPGSLGMGTILAFGALLFLVAPRLAPPPGWTLGFRPAPRLAWLAVPLLVPSLLWISEFDNLAKEFLPAPPTAQDLPRISGSLVALEWLLLLCVINPLGEEVLFRGLFQPGFVRAWGRWGIPASAGLYAASSVLVFGPSSLGFAFAFGGVLAIVRECSGSILPGVALHGLFGVVSFVALGGGWGIPGFDDPSSAHTPLEWLVFAGLFVAAGLWLCRAASRQVLTEPITLDDDPDR